MVHTHRVIHGSCLEKLTEIQEASIDLIFLDPPFNQHKEYTSHNDSMDAEQYWKMMRRVCALCYTKASKGAAIYFMQREKNTEYVLQTLRETGWHVNNLIIWKKKTSAVPINNKFGKHYQVIAYGTKGNKSRTFHRLRIDPPLLAHYKHPRPSGIFLTDVWDDIRELTSGFYAGKEAIREKNGERSHKQQAPIELLLRILLSSTDPYDTVLDPFSGTGTTAVVAKQLKRSSVSIEIDEKNLAMIQKRMAHIRQADHISTYYKTYIHTPNLADIWGNALAAESLAHDKVDQYQSVF